MTFRAIALMAVVAILLSTGGIAPVGLGVAVAGESEKTKEADALRRAAKAKAKGKIGYPNVFDYVHGDSDRSADFYYLSRQIEQLSRYLRDVSRSLVLTPPPGPPGSGGPADDINAVYGPDGPTVKSVRLILEYRLLVAGNPRLQVGTVSDDGTTVTAEVVTREGSVVDEYRIDKKTGVWTPVRGGKP